MAKISYVGPEAVNTHRSLRAALLDQDVEEIVLAPGLYVEHLVIQARTRPLLIRSVDGNPAETVISFGLCQGDRDRTGMEFVQDCATLTIRADDVTLRGITVENTFDRAAHPGRPNTQALALRTLGTRIVLDGCRLLGRQDTVLLDANSWADIARVHLHDCEIVGDVDFIYGRATALIERGVIRSIGPGYICAPSTARENPRGFLFHNVEVIGPLPAGSVKLGRPWHPGNKADAIGNAVFSNCFLGSHVSRTPWDDMGANSWRDARLAESGNTGPGAAGGERPQLPVAPDPRTWLEGWNSTPRSAPNIVIVGDSTSSDYPTDLSPRTGWGQALKSLLQIPVQNHAQSGASSKSFIDLGLIDAALDHLEPGSLLLIAFGHNEGKPDARFSDAFTQFEANLRRYIVGARSRQAVPVLITPIARRKYSSDLQPLPTHAPYDERIRALASDEGVHLIDLTAWSEHQLRALGPMASRSHYMWLEPGAYPGYPDGAQDDTHLSLTGAEAAARMVANELHRLEGPVLGADQRSQQVAS